MYQKIQDNVIATLATNSKIRESILEEFLLTANKLSNQVKQLLSDGVDVGKCISLRSPDLETKVPSHYTFLDEKMVFAFQKDLDKILKSKTDIPKKFSSYITGRYSKLCFEYSEIPELMFLSNLYVHSCDAEQKLLRMKEELLPF